MQNRNNNHRVSALPYEEPRRNARLVQESGRPRGGQPSRDDRRESSPNGKKRSRLKIHRTVVTILIVLALLFNTGLSAVTSVFGMMTLVDKDQNPSQSTIPQQPLEDSELVEVSESDFQIPEGAIMSDKDVEVILVVGCDLRPDVDGGKGRSDTMMLVFLDRINKKIKIASIMRDLWAPMAGFKGSNKINYAYYLDTAYKHLDIHVTRNTIQKCFGVQIDHFVVLNFQCFVEVINAIGFVEVEITDAEAKYLDDNNRWWLTENLGRREGGLVTLCGQEALAYCRARYVGNGDFDRTHRQQYFISQLMKKIEKEASFSMLKEVLETALPNITTDFSEGEMLGYLVEAPKILDYEMVSLTFPVEGSYRMGWATVGKTNISILCTNYTFCAEAMRKFIYEDDMTYVNGGVASGVNIIRPTTISFTTTTEFTDTTTSETPSNTIPTDTPPPATIPTDTPPPATIPTDTPPPVG
ncbi:MAG: LytR family transcriptional regulator [Ruminococcaceae bacterium]|nr:LytR family transcriptional regulator [Oscillospiraceae bacterium]